MISLLNARLADMLDLRSQVKQAHWNVKGHGFYSVHELLDKIAGELDLAADEVAERAVQLGGVAMGTARMAAAASTLGEYPARLSSQQRTLQTVADRLAAVGGAVRTAIDESDDAGDKGTADLFTQTSRMLDKNLWFIESHLHA
jgi:starvation-inducible DNA-binding protein